MIALLLALAAPQAAAPQLVETGVGRFAVFADIASITRNGDVARMRSLQVVEVGFRAGNAVYVGGWSRWAFECRAGMADLLDFSSLRQDGVEGPATPDPAPAYAAAPGGDAAELMAVACNGAGDAPTLTVEQAITRGQAELAE